jgi:hypothetical protein
MSQHSISWQRTKPSAHDREFAYNKVSEKQILKTKKEPLKIGVSAPDFTLKDTTPPNSFTV